MVTKNVFNILELKTNSYINKNLNNKKFCLQFLPQSLELFSKQKYFYYKEKKIKTSYIIDILHNLILKYYFKKENKFYLYSCILKEKYGHLYNYYINFLIENKILILLTKHQKGKHSRVYALNEYILRGNIIRYHNYDKVLLKKFKNKLIQIDCDNDNKESLIQPEIKLKLIEDLFKVKIQFDRSIFFLNSTKNDIDVYNKNKYSVECIKDGHIFYHFDNYGRMHTNFTILKSTIRKNCLLIEGEDTKEFDINNSQPLFLTKLIYDVDTKWVNKNEYELFKYLTVNGVFYKYLIDNLQLKNKEDAKELTYKVLFGKNRSNSNADKKFSKIFPTIYNFIKLYKKEHNDYRVLSHDLQRLESNLIYNKIIREIIILYPHVSLITVHDSIIVKKSHQDIIEPIFKMKLHEEFNFNI